MNAVDAGTAFTASGDVMTCNVMAVKSDGSRAFVVGCSSRTEAQHCVDLLRAVGGGAIIEEVRASE